MEGFITIYKEHTCLSSLHLLLICLLSMYITAWTMYRSICSTWFRSFCVEELTMSMLGCEAPSPVLYIAFHRLVDMLSVLVFYLT